ncbi:MAG TPA: DUF305 domain-containing protein, partial [Pilimelia sp.]|nr:DUF305 domain-containing protein [Pilimelia sp.]
GPTAGDPAGGDPAQPPAAAGAAGGRGRFGTGALAAMLAIGLLLGYALGWLTPRVTAPGDDSVEAGFARDMITHHTQAVEIGLSAFKRSTDSAVAQLAVDMAASQQGEIGMMNAWLRNWHLDPTSSQPRMAWMPADMRQVDEDGLMPGMASQAELARLRAAEGKALDILFLQLMIRHHLGGIHMIDAALAATDRDEVRETAQTMKSTQDGEIAVLTSTLTRLGANPLPAN